MGDGDPTLGSETPTPGRDALTADSGRGQPAAPVRRLTRIRVAGQRPIAGWQRGPVLAPNVSDDGQSSAVRCL